MDLGRNSKDASQIKQLRENKADEHQREPPESTQEHAHSTFVFLLK